MGSRGLRPDLVSNPLQRDAAMTSEAHITTIDPDVAGRAALPSVPSSGVVLVHVHEESGDVCAWHVLEFARRWRDQGRRIHLCDACVEAPVLHHAADVENAEGVTDSILYGSSLERITVPLEKGIVLTTAGTVAGDPSRVLDHPRWTSIASSIRDAGGLLVVTVPSDADAARLEGLADAAVRFVPGDTEDPSSGASDADADAELDSPLAPAEPETTSETQAISETEAASETEATPTAAASPVRRTTRDESGSRGLLLFVLLLLALVGVLGAGVFGFIEIPGITPVDVDPAIDLFPLR